MRMRMIVRSKMKILIVRRMSKLMLNENEHDFDFLDPLFQD
jgi:hypothetical protein